MREFVIMTDSCCDLTAQLADELEVKVLPLSVLMGEKTFRNYLDGRDIGFHEFYDRIREGAMPTTSAVSVGDFEDAMRAIAAEGKDILCINFSGALSTTYQSAVIAADEVGDEYPEVTIRVVDSKSASLGQGLLVYLCVQQQKAGKSLEEVCAYAETTKQRIGQWFTVDDLNHLKRGGRVSAATALVGTMLAIKPVLQVNKEGLLVSAAKARGRKAALMALVDQLEKTGNDLKDQTIFISHGDSEEDAKILAAEVEKRLGVETRLINYVGPVIGAHTGPGVVALFFLEKEA